MESQEIKVEVITDGSGVYLCTEGVIPKPLMDGLQSAANGGSMGGNTTHVTNVHNHNNLSALDSSGMADVLEKHSDLIEQHVDKAFRRRGM
jgi:hypothetical protein